METHELPLPTIDRGRCTGCHACIEVCPTGALAQVGGRAALVQPSACIWCNRCERICPTDAIGLPYLIRFARAANHLTLATPSVTIHGRRGCAASFLPSADGQVQINV